MEKDMVMTGRRYDSLFMAGLLLFGFSIGISKSATNVVAALLLFGVIGLVLSVRSFRSTIWEHVRQPLLLPLLVYIGVALFGLFFSPEINDGIGSVNKMFGLLLVYFLTAVLLDSLYQGEDLTGKAKQLLIAFIAGVFALNIIAVLTYAGLVGHKKLVLPLAPMSVHHIWFSNLNAIGLYCAAAFLLFSYSRLSGRAKTSLVISMLFSCLCILFSLSRTAWFGVLLTCVVMAYLLLKNKKYFLIAAVAVGAGCVVLYSTNSIVHERIGQIGGDISQYSASTRTETSVGDRFLMWKAALKMFRSNPLIGVGTGGYVPTMTSYIKQGLLPEYLLGFNQPHNMYLFALATNGILGLGALLFIFYSGLRFSLPMLKKEEGERKIFAFVAVATIVHFLIAGMTDSFLNIQILRYTFGFITGVCILRCMKRGSGQAV